MFFAHFSANDDAVNLAQSLRAALDKTNVPPKDQVVNPRFYLASFLHVGFALCSSACQVWRARHSLCRVLERSQNGRRLTVAGRIDWSRSTGPLWCRQPARIRTVLLRF
jgi:hypothetical protein